MFNLKNTSPYADIKKEQLVYGDTMTSKAFGVKIEAPYDEGIFNQEKMGWKEVGIVSSDYLLVPNETMVQMAEDVIAGSTLEFEEEKQFWNGKQFFRSWKCTDEIDAEVQEGDNLGIGVGLWNSYDGSISGRMIQFVYRLVCTNGMTSKENFAEYIFKHDIHNKDWKHEIEKTMKVLDNAEENVKDFALSCSKLPKHFIRVNDLANVRKDAFSSMGTGVFGKALDQFLTNEKYETRTAWDLMNAGTDVFWHNDKQTISDFNHNKQWVDGCLKIAA